MGFLLVCAVIAVIMIASRLNARVRSQPGHPAPRLLAGPKGRRPSVVDAPDGGRQVIGTPPAAAPQQPNSRSRAPAQGRTQPQAQTPPQAEAPAQPVPTREPPEPPSPLDMLSPKIAQVPPELAARVVTLMNKRQEVSAVRLLCDELRIGILDAQKTARSLVRR